MFSLRLVEYSLGWNNAAFTNKYHIHSLLWFEETQYVLNAIGKEKALKSLFRDKKEAIITEFNPRWRFLNEQVLGNWPPNEEQVSLARLRKSIFLIYIAQMLKIKT